MFDYLGHLIVSSTSDLAGNRNECRGHWIIYRTDPDSTKERQVLLRVEEGQTEKTFDDWRDAAAAAREAGMARAKVIRAGV